MQEEWQIETKCSSSAATKMEFMNILVWIFLCNSLLILAWASTCRSPSHVGTKFLQTAFRKEHLIPVFYDLTHKITESCHTLQHLRGQGGQHPKCIFLPYQCKIIQVNTSKKCFGNNVGLVALGAALPNPSPRNIQVLPRSCSEDQTHSRTAWSLCSPTDILGNISQAPLPPGASKASPYLPTQVNDVGVWVIEGQQDPVAGVHLMKGYWLLHVFLEIKMPGILIKTGKVSVHREKV